MSASSLTVAFLDVGQGDSTVLLLPSKVASQTTSAVVVDCPPKAATAYEYLLGARISHLSFAVITHTDHDHIGGMGELLDNFLAAGNSASALAYHHDTFNPGKVRKATLRHLLQTARRAGVRTCSPFTGHTWDTGEGVKFEVLHPDDEDLKDAQLSNSQNEASIVLRVSYGGRRFLLTGDIGGKGWLCMFDRSTDLKADFLRYPHHGAWYLPRGRQPSLPDVLAQIDPEVVVFSVGAANIHGHPDVQSVELLRSMPKVRFAHTQPTPQCYSDGAATPWPRQFSDRGTVEIVVHSTGYLLFVLRDAGDRTEVDVT